MTDTESSVTSAAHEQADARRYRSAIPLIGGSVGALAFLLLGIAMVINGARSDVSAAAVGAVIIVFACALAAAVSTNVAELTAAGLAYRFNFRRKLIPWTAIESFRIARGPGTGPWSGLIVQLGDGNSVLVGSVVGTKRFVQRVTEEIEAFRMHLEPAFVSKPGAERIPDS